MDSTKTLLTIGVGPGIGYATAERFARAGFRAILAARSRPRLEALAQRLRMAVPGTDVSIECVDAADAASVDALVARHASTIDVLHYNAGVLRYREDGALLMQPIVEQSTDAIASDIAINLTGALIALRSVLPAMVGRSSGSVLLTGGGLARQPSADLLTLSVGKAGIDAIARALFEPLRALGVHVAAVTVSTRVAADSQDSRDIAERFWQLHDAPRDAWVGESAYP
jgi:short-subunit dehydrogenase